MLNRIRMAGDYLRKVDQRYADGLASLLSKHSNGNPIAETAIQLTTSPVQRLQFEDAAGALRPAQGFAEQAMSYGVPALSAGVRYGLPAAALYGVSNAIGKGYDALSEVPVLGQ